MARVTKRPGPKLQVPPRPCRCTDKISQRRIISSPTPFSTAAAAIDSPILYCGYGSLLSPRPHGRPSPPLRTPSRLLGRLQIVQSYGCAHQQHSSTRAHTQCLIVHSNVLTPAPTMHSNENTHLRSRSHISTRAHTRPYKFTEHQHSHTRAHTRQQPNSDPTIIFFTGVHLAS